MSDASGENIIDLGGPEGGRYWRVVSGHPVDHPDAQSAAVHARATGSVGATYNDVKVERVDPEKDKLVKAIEYQAGKALDETLLELTLDLAHRFEAEGVRIDPEDDSVLVLPDGGRMTLTWTLARLEGKS